MHILTFSSMHAYMHAPLQASDLTIKNSREELGMIPLIPLMRLPVVINEEEIVMVMELT